MRLQVIGFPAEVGGVVGYLRDYPGGTVERVSPPVAARHPRDKGKVLVYVHVKAKGEEGQ